MEGIKKWRNIGLLVNIPWFHQFCNKSSRIVALHMCLHCRFNPVIKIKKDNFTKVLLSIPLEPLKIASHKDLNTCVSDSEQLWVSLFNRRVLLSFRGANNFYMILLLYSLNCSTTDWSLISNCIGDCWIATRFSTSVPLHCLHKRSLLASSEVLTLTSARLPLGLNRRRFTIYCRLSASGVSSNTVNS